MKSKILLPLVYGAVIWLIGIFIFGSSGVLDNIYQSKEIIRLTKTLITSQQELENMVQEYYVLSSMEKPNDAFLIDQGRKVKKIILFKINEENQHGSDKGISLTDEKTLLIQSSIIFLIVLSLGFFGIFIVTYWYHKKKNVISKEKE